MTDAPTFAFLRRLLDAPGPSGYEIEASRVWRGEAEGIADRVVADVSGNTLATLNPGGSPRVMLAGHIDEIGLIVTHVDEEGYLYVDGIGGWDPQVLVGQRIRILGRGGPVIGVVGKKPIHLMKPDEKEKASKLSELWVDVGAADREEVARRGIRVGDSAVIDAGMVRMGDDLIASRAVDNRIGAFVVLEALRLLAARPERGPEVTAVATTQEEIGYSGGGARASAYRVDPQIALVVDVTFASDAPGIEKKQTGEHKLGGGPVLGRGAALHPIVFERLAEAAEAEGIPYTIQANGRFTSTDADAIYLSREGVATGLLSVPNRYMHSPNEMVSLRDLDATARLIAAFVARLGDASDFIPAEPRMLTIDEIRVEAPPERCFELGADVERWPEILPHYRWVRFQRKEGIGTGRVEMAANRGFGPLPYPVWWVSEMHVDRERPAVIYRHVDGITTGMDVEWTFEPLPGGATQVRIVHDWDGGPAWPLPGLARRQIADRVIGPVFIHHVASRTLRGIKAAAERR